MKKFMKFLCAGVLISGLCVGFVSCEKSGNAEVDSLWSPDANCMVFVRTTPEEETILLARSWIPWGDTQDAIRDSLTSIYGEGNIRAGASSPLIIDPDSPALKPGGLDCYEYTLLFEFNDEASVPPDDELDNSFTVFRRDGRTVTGKFYWWASTEEMAETYISDIKEMCFWIAYLGISPVYDDDRFKKIGTLARPVSMKNLGPELHNVPIEF